MSNFNSWSFSPESRSILAVVLRARELVEWSWSRGDEQRAPMPFETGAERACWSTDGSRLAVGSTNGSVQIWDLPGRTVRANLRTEHKPAVPVQFHENNQQIALKVPDGDNRTHIQIYETSTGKSLLSRPVPPNVNPVIIRDGRNFTLQLSPDLSRLFARTQS